MNTHELLEERGKRYGSYMLVAETSQRLKATMHNHKNWDKLWPDQKESLDMIAVKISRALNGDLHYLDNWDDMAAYAVLVADRLRKGEKQ